MTSLITDFFHKYAIKNKPMLILLSNDVLFEKIIPFQQNTDSKASRDDFINKIPFQPQSRATVSIEHEKQLFVYATNKELYDILVAVGREFKNKIIAVTPAAAYGLGESTRYTKQELNHLFKEASLAKKINFLIKT